MDFRRPLVSSAIAGLFFLGCETKTPEPDTGDTAPGLNISVTEPVNRDFDAIKKEGVLRMITSYSSSSYFLYGGVERGFEYELVKEFAKKNGLALEVIILHKGDNPYDLLNNGTGDLIAAGYTKTEERNKYVDFTRPYNLVDQILVYNNTMLSLEKNIEELKPVTVSVRRNSSYYQNLIQLKKQGHPIEIDVVANDMDTESLLFSVSQGEYTATVSDNNLFDAATRYMNNLSAGSTIARNDTIAWVVRENSNNLEEKMNDFLFNHFRLSEPGTPPKRSAFLNILRKRYFGDGNNITRFYEPTGNSKYAGILSPYDKLIKPIADSANIDWLMLASIIAQESKFNPESKSWAGAVGLMQIIPRFSEVDSVNQLYNPETNIREGVRIIKEHLKHYSYMDSTNQWKFALATYNSGMGHIADARRLAIDQNRNPNNWGHVSSALLQLMRRKFYKDARYGFARGIETVRYVREVTNRYETYKTILNLSEQPNPPISAATVEI